MVLSIVNHGNDLPGKVVGNHLSPTKVTISRYIFSVFFMAGELGYVRVRSGEFWQAGCCLVR